MGNPMSEQIARIIEEMLEQSGGVIELRRNKFAEDVGCVPSQINYVISSRFNHDRGYIVESRRGGGGYIKIRKIVFDSKTAFLMHMLSAIGDEIDSMSAKAMLVSLFDNGLVTERELSLMLSVISDRALIRIVQGKGRDTVRADIMKSLILTLK
ncbi:MAG: CtsR family transcriptional regulator [Ruminococcaceae bacterium]|nr:CtsR family transcriptional regulator [Oscillospiraceae bacterium]